MKNSSSLFLLLLNFGFLSSFAQIGIGTNLPSASAVLDVTSTTKGLLTPRMTTLQRNAIPSPALGLIVYNIDDASFNTYNGSTLGWQDFTARYKTITSISNATSASTSDEVVSEMSISPPEGNYMVTFNSEFKNNPIITVTTIVTPNTSSISSSNCSPAFTNAIASLDAVANTDAAFTDLLGTDAGQIVYPGKYYIPAALALRKNITLDAGGNPNALFIFQANGAINSSVFTTITLAGGAKACNVFWVALGGIGIGADCTIVGNFIARTAAIAVGFRSTLEGRLLSGGGAIAFGPGTASVPLGTSSIDLGILKDFIIYTHAGGLGNVIDGANTTSIYQGYILSDAGAATGFETATLQHPIIPAGGSILVSDGTSTTTYVSTETENTVLGMANFSIYSNGSLVANSTKTLPSNAVNATISLSSIISVSNGNSVEIRWNTTSQTLLMKNRTLTLIRVQ